MLRPHLDAAGCSAKETPRTGNSPSLMHRDDLRRVSPYWANFSVALHEDQEARAAPPEAVAADPRRARAARGRRRARRSADWRTHRRFLIVGQRAGQEGGGLGGGDVRVLARGLQGACCCGRRPAAIFGSRCCRSTFLDETRAAVSATPQARLNLTLQETEFMIHPPFDTTVRLSGLHSVTCGGVHLERSLLTVLHCIFPQLNNTKIIHFTYGVQLFENGTAANPSVRLRPSSSDAVPSRVHEAPPPLPPHITARQKN